MNKLAIALVNSSVDKEFRLALISDPKGFLNSVGVQIPDCIEVELSEDSSKASEISFKANDDGKTIVKISIPDEISDCDTKEERKKIKEEEVFIPYRNVV